MRHVHAAAVRPFAVSTAAACSRAGNVLPTQLRGAQSRQPQEFQLRRRRTLRAQSHRLRSALAALSL